MANPEHLQRFQAKDWNKWRAEHPKIVPDLSGARLRKANLNGANLKGVNLKKADLPEAGFRKADLSGANLSGANLKGADLGGATVRKAVLDGADLSRARLIGASFSEAELTGVQLAGAMLNGAKFRRANLSRANLGGASLHGTVLGWANLRGADLTGAILGYTIFGAANLRDPKGLAECRFLGPCILDHRAIQKSGSLPLPFLRGCGLPDSLIQYLPSLLNERTQFFSCFISYSTKDQGIAERLHADLQNRGVRCWFAPHDIRGGRKIHDQIEEAIRLHDKLLLILSDASMNSTWVKNEIANARAREDQQHRKMLFPITVVPFDRIKNWKFDSAREIREYFIPDFSNWRDHDSYQKAFDRLLRDLKAEGQGKTPV